MRTIVCIPGLEPAGRGSCIPRRDRYDCWQWLEVAEDVMADRGEMMLTVFLKHRQSMNLAEINQKLEQTGFWQKFPPEGVEVVSWYVMMGIGQVVTLKLPADQLRAVNLAIEQNAWGAFGVLPDLRLPPGVGRDQEPRRGAARRHLMPIWPRS